MKRLSLIIFLILCWTGVAFGQSRTAERVVDVPFSQLNIGNPPNDSIRYVINGTQGTTPCVGGGTGALAIKVAGVWQCPKLSPGAGTGDVGGPSVSSDGELVLYSGPSGKSIGRSNTLDGIPLLTAGVVSTLTSSGTGAVVRVSAAAITNAALITPTIASFVNATHAHESAIGGGQLNAGNVFNTGTIPPARVITGALTNSKCLRLNNLGQIAVAADDCGTGSGGTPGGISGNLTFNESGSFGGYSTSSLNTTTGVLTLTQKADSNDLFVLRRFTDTSPTGTLLRLRNAANDADLFYVGANAGVYMSTTILSKNVAAPSTPAAGNTTLWTDAIDKNLKAQDSSGNVSGTVRPISCSGTDKVSAISSAGVVTCTADQSTAGSGVITLNGLTASDQTFVAVDDTNIDLTVSSASSVHTITAAWIGTLAKARQNAATVYNDASNTWTTGTQSFAPAASLIVPVSAGASPSASGVIAYDSTSDTWEVGVNSTNRTVAFTQGSQTFSDKTLDNSTTANLRDTLWTLQDNTDSTKTVNFELSGITTGTNRVVTIANAPSVTVQSSTLTANQFVTHIDSAGVAQKAQPSFANLSGTMGETQGGTGQTSYAQGDILIASATNTLSKLAKSTSATRYLANTGASNNPQWDLVNVANGVTGIQAADNGGTGNAFFQVTGPATSVKTYTFPNASTTILTTNAAVTVAQGGTGQTTATTAFNALDPLTTKGDILTHDGTNSVRLAVGGTNGFVLKVNSATSTGLEWAANTASAGGSTTQLQYNNAGSLAGLSTVTTDGTIVTIAAGDLLIGNASTLPTPALGKLGVDTDDGKLYYGVDGSTWGEVFVSGLSVVNLASANVTGTLPLANGGTNQTSWTASRCVQVNSAGTALESASAACGSGGGSGTVTVVASGSLTSTALVTGGGTTTLQTPSATSTLDSSGNMSLAGSLTLAGSGAGYTELAEGTIPTAVANRVTVAAPTDVTAAGWVLSLPATAGTTGQFLQTNGSGVTTWASPSGSGTVTATGGSLTANAVVLGAGTTDTKVVAGIITDGTSKLTLGVAGSSVGSIDFKNATSGTITLAPVTGALGTVTLSLPAATDTLVGKATTDVFTNKTFNTAGTGNAFSINGQSITSVSGNTAKVVTTTGTLTSGRCVEIDASGNFIQAAAACGSGGGGTITAGATNAVPKYTASTTIDDSLLSDDATTLTYSGSGGLSLTATGGGFVQFTEGTPPAIVANTVQLAVAADAPAAGVQYLFGSVAAASGVLRVANSSGVMTVTQDAGISHLASSTSADLASVLSDEQGTGGGFVRATSPTLTTPVLGVATATSINGNTFTTGTYTLTGSAGKTLTFSNSITFAGTDSTTQTFQASDTIVGRATTDTLTNKTIDVEGTGNSITTLSVIDFPAAGCNNATASSFWDLPTSTPAVATCVSGTNTQKSYLDFADTSGGFSAQTGFRLPADFTGTVDAKISWLTTATSGNVKWSLSTICVATDATETDDPAFNTASTVTTAAPGVASRLQTSAITSVTITGCAAGEFMHVKISRDGNDAADTIAATARLVGVQLILRRAQ